MQKLKIRTGVISSRCHLITPYVTLCKVLSIGTFEEEAIYINEGDFFYYLLLFGWWIAGFRQTILI